MYGAAVLGVGTMLLAREQRMAGGTGAAWFLQSIKELIEEPYLWVAEGYGHLRW
jgi:hypothetical protein